jgi:hypothetical protein
LIGAKCQTWVNLIVNVVFIGSEGLNAYHKVVVEAY